MNKEKGFGGKKNLWLKAVERKFKYSSESKIDDPSSSVSFTEQINLIGK